MNREALVEEIKANIQLLLIYQARGQCYLQQARVVGLAKDVAVIITIFYRVREGDQ